MEEKNVRPNGRLPMYLGILAFLTSFPFWLLLMTIFPHWSCEGFSPLCMYYYGGGWFFLSIISLLLGVSALITGIISKIRTKGKNGNAIAGILLGIYGILGGLLFYYLTFVLGMYPM